MIKVPILNRIFLLITGHLAGYMVVTGINGYDFWTTFYYTIAFGVLILACLLLILFGFEILESVMVVVMATLIPLSLSLGIISNYLPQFKIPYLLFTILGLIFILFTKIYKSDKIATIILAVVHGLAGLIIFLLPIILSVRGITSPWFSLVGIGGALIGLVGLMLAAIKLGKPLISQKTIYDLFPLLMLIMTALFVLGMSLN